MGNKHFKITVKEVGVVNPVETEYHGNIDRKGLIDFFGLNNSNVEWYKIKEFTNLSKYELLSR
jgi:hypothetical protein|nr:MAG TPA: hypothetical protein [Caudoviricetes sp.]